jgi:hypothetical protein
MNLGGNSPCKVNLISFLGCISKLLIRTRNLTGAKAGRYTVRREIGDEEMGST